MATFRDYMEEIATVLDDNPSADPQIVLDFESRKLLAGKYESILIYRDWLEEHGCKVRMAQLNCTLEQELEALVILSQERISKTSREFVEERIEVLKRVLAGQEAYLRRPFQGTLVIWYPNEEYRDTESGKTRLAREIARDLAKQILEGGAVGIPSTRDENGHLKWGIEVIGGHPAQVRIKPREET